MTYCIGITVNDGLVFASDSRTNAGVDQVNSFSKMHRFFGDGERMITVLTAGNLATSQAVMRQVRRDIDSGDANNLKNFRHMAEVADYIGGLSVTAQNKHRARTNNQGNFDTGASFIVGGQIAGKSPQIFLVYPEGNHIRATARTSYLQIGELKYGKPILDRIIEPALDLETAARCAMVSMDSTLRSNLTVGPPVEILIYTADSLNAGEHIVFEEDDDYLRELRNAWHESLKTAFEGLPRLTGASKPATVHLMDAPGDH